MEGPGRLRVVRRGPDLSRDQPRDPRLFRALLGQLVAAVSRSSEVHSELRSALRHLRRSMGLSSKSLTGGLIMSFDYTNFGASAAELLERVRAKAPLIHHITNFVVMNDTANATLALGALSGDGPRQGGGRRDGRGGRGPGAESRHARAGLGRGHDHSRPPRGRTRHSHRLRSGRRRRDELPQRDRSALFARAAHIGRAGQFGRGRLARRGRRPRQGRRILEGVADPFAVARAFAKRTGATVAITGKRDILSDGKRPRASTTATP